MSELYVKFGELLKLERKRKTLKLEDLSEQLKISVENLEHIENGDVNSLPSMIYFGLFAKAYSETLGIDFDRTMEAIKEDLGEPIDIEEAPIPTTAKKKSGKKAKAEEDAEPPSENARSIKKLVYLFGAIIAVFIVFVVIYQIFWASDVQNGPSHSTATESHEVVTDEPPQQTDSGKLAGYDWNTPEYQKPGNILLKLIPRNESWSTVLADGDTVIFRNLIPGRIYTAEAEYRLTVSVGIPSQVITELNGKEVNLADPETGRVSRVEIDQINLNQFLSPQVDTTEIEAPQTLQKIVNSPPPNRPVLEPVDSSNISSADEDSSGQD